MEAKKKEFTRNTPAKLSAHPSSFLASEERGKPILMLLDRIKAGVRNGKRRRRDEGERTRVDDGHAVIDGSLVRTAFLKLSPFKEQGL
ncbi:hypothetical protein RvY_11300 [Ramazzottius varieornatus]|uniref:Uncharacterized protein n=1 Tax=Ramazzottius varieornatus TaxID=947166 RepID=A0A1D1VFL7_RAMVA|nr:hypothetical protein RvY_11300 [Ramazzottius varieornatus]